MLALVATGCAVAQTPTAIPLPSIPPTAVPNQGTATPRTAPTTAAPAPTGWTPRAIGGSIVVAGVGQPLRQVTALPPFIAAGLYDSLLEIEPVHGALMPGVAESWQVSPDGRTLTFHLRSDVRWHDGQALTARDVVFTYKTLSDSALRLTPGGDFTGMTNVQAPDDQTVVVTLKDPDCSGLTSLGSVRLLPQHILQDKNLGELTNEQLIGSGPLVLKSWTPDAITLARSPTYWNGPVPISSWTYKIFQTPADAQAAVSAGQADLFASDPAPDQTGPNTGEVRTRTYPSNQFYALALNQESTLLRDAQVRQALAAALDRSQLARSMWGERAVVLSTSVLPSFWAAPSNAPTQGFDLDRARQLLASAGWSDSNGDGILDKNGKPLRVTLWAIAGDPVDEPLALSIRAMLARAGVQAIVQLDDRPDFLTRVFLHEFDLALAPWNIPPDPDQRAYWQSTENKKGSGFNISSFSNGGIDDLLGRGLGVPQCDVSARRSIYSDLYRGLAQDLPEVFLFAPPSQVIARSRVDGLAPSSFAGPFWNLYRWQVAS